VYVFLLRFRSLDQLARALGDLYDDLGVADCLVDRTAREIRVRSAPTRLEPHLERFYARRALVWVSRHRVGAVPPPG
jgi:hypothetical protein